MTAITCVHCGAEFEPPKKAQRSYPQLKRFFALMRAAFNHWPEKHDFQPRSVEHLRYWLEVQAGHCEIVKTIRCETVDPAQLTAVLTAVLKASDDDTLFIEASGAQVIVKKAISVSYAALAHMSACALFNQIDDVLKANGFDPDKLISEEAKAA